MTERKSRPPKALVDRESFADLDKERDAFIQTFFKKGAQLTEELLKENERLRKHVREIESENAALRAHVKSEDAIREFIKKIEGLESEKMKLLSSFREVAAKTDAFASTFAEVEAELSNLASLYVASNQLHSTLNLRGVVRQIKEMLAQLVGAKSFAIYFVSDNGGELVPIVHEGIRSDEVHRVPVGDGPIGSAFFTGIASIKEEGDLTECGPSSPAACVPLRVEDRVIGVIALFSTFAQKTKFLPVDYEFFKLLAAHAASAIIAARLFSEANGRAPGIDAFLDLGV